MTAEETRREIIACVTLLAGTLRQELTEVLLRGYSMALGDMTAGEIRQATARAVSECKFMPAPAELRAFAGRKPLAERGQEAWLVVRGAMDRYDVYEGVDFGPLVNAVVADLGGWVYLCDCSIPDLVWREKEFIEKFRDRANRPIDQGRGAPMRGALSTSTIHRIEAPGSEMPRALPSRAQSEINGVVRELADAKAAP